MSDHDKIRQRAFEIWETQGRPQGRDLDHWLQAEAEVIAPLAPPRKRAAKKEPAAEKQPAARKSAAKADKKAASADTEKPAAPKRTRSLAKN